MAHERIAYECFAYLWGTAVLWEDASILIVSMYSTIDSSKRDTSNVIILPRKTNTFLYISSKLWNCIHKLILNENGEILTTSVSLVKLCCKTIIQASQSISNNNTWTYQNFHIAPHLVTDQYRSSLTHQTADPISIEVAKII